MSTLDVIIRPAQSADRDFMFGLAPRLAGVAGLPWHAVSDLVAFQHRYMKLAFARPKDEIVTLIAEDQSGAPLGFVHAEASTDSVTLEPCGYVTVLATVAAAEGKGVAQALMQGVEDWARGKGFRLIGLDVFANNQRARAFYRRMGYAEDSLRLTKPLQQGSKEIA
ncbi:MAG TPA: GNAT family N-acetyltransferase [Alphaproteobacteria bacterium]|nr:GNAT family N-acetyltransferase [Alphaproteobacteria bacterium]